MNRQSYILQFFLNLSPTKKKIGSIVLQLILWVGIFFFWHRNNCLRGPIVNVEKDTFIFFLVFISSYINILYLYPVFFRKKHFGIYFGALSVLVIGMSIFECAYVIDNILNLYDPYVKDKYLITLIFSTLKFILIRNILFLSAGILIFLFIDSLSSYTTSYQNYKFIKANFEVEEKRLQNEEENVKLQIRIHKLQVNEHFLFNLIKHIDHSVSDEEGTALPAMCGLTNLLSYSVSNSAKASVRLDDEISFVKEYLNLKKIIYPKQNFIFDFFLDENIADLPIIPMVFNKILDNAFSYGKNSSDNLVRINLQVREMTFLHFSSKSSVENNDPLTIENALVKELDFTKERLSEAYPSHTLDMKIKDSICEINLVFNLNEFIA